MTDEYYFDYDKFLFKLFMPEFWVKIYKGKKRQPLPNDYCLMLDVLKGTGKDRYVLDIGSNYGFFSVPASKLGYMVFGFEPVADNFYSLLKAAELNELKNFDMFQLALSNKNEEVEIYVPECPDNSSLSATAAVSNMADKGYRVEKVDTTRFDDWIVNNPAYNEIGFIKMDVQGSEYIILEGMKEYLTNKNDIYLICEYEPHINVMGHTFEQLDRLIKSYGFEFKQQLTPSDKLFYKP